jgi:hypothetical protein
MPRALEEIGIKREYIPERHVRGAMSGCEGNLTAHGLSGIKVAFSLP